jgi:nucleoside-diphosphate-sugar epimerase
MTKRILITGANGFIGRYCVEAFAKHEWETVALTRTGAPIPFAEANLACDLLDDTQVLRTISKSDATHLLHLAWLSDARTRWTSPINREWTSASMRLAETFSTCGGQHMIFAGSCAEYAWDDTQLIAGQSVINPKTEYGRAKAKTGKSLLDAQKRLGLEIAHARLFFCYGDGEPSGRLLPDLIQSIENGQPFPTSEGNQKRDYLYAADIAEAFRLIADAGATGVYNIASGTAVEVRELVKTTANLLARPDLPQFGALPRRDGDPDVIEGNIDPLRNLGFKPEFDLSTGLKDTISRRRARI